MDEARVCRLAAIRSLRKVVGRRGLCVDVGGVDDNVMLVGKCLPIDKHLGRLLSSSKICAATVASSAPVLWEQPGWTRRGVFLPGSSCAIVVHKQVDGTWTSGRTGDVLSGRGGSAPTALLGVPCDITARVDMTACEEAVRLHLDATTEVLAGPLPRDLARRICIESLCGCDDDDDLGGG